MSDASTSVELVEFLLKSWGRHTPALEGVLRDVLTHKLKQNESDTIRALRRIEAAVLDSGRQSQNLLSSLLKRIEAAEDYAIANGQVKVWKAFAAAAPVGPDALIDKLDQSMLRGRARSVLLRAKQDGVIRLSQMNEKNLLHGTRGCGPATFDELMRWKLRRLKWIPKAGDTVLLRKPGDEYEGKVTWVRDMDHLDGKIVQLVDPKPYRAMLHRDSLCVEDPSNKLEGCHGQWEIDLAWCAPSSDVGAEESTQDAG